MTGNDDLVFCSASFDSGVYQGSLALFINSLVKCDLPHSTVTEGGSICATMKADQGHKMRWTSGLKVNKA